MISFIIPVKDGLSYTQALVRTVQEQNPGTDVEWVIVDSGSTDGTLEWASRIGARVVPLRRTPFNYCAAINAGGAVAAGDVWIVANNDLEFRSAGSLERLEGVFREWPLVAILCPGRESGGAEVEFRLDWLYGPCWAVRPEVFRSWGGLPEALSGYGYDEVYSVCQCWRAGYGVAWLTGWDVFHHGSVTFGPLAGTTTPAMRRNLSRLLSVMNAPDLDRGTNPLPILNALRRRELEGVTCRLALTTDARWYVPERQGYANVRRVDASNALPEDAASVLAPSEPQPDRQWLPWLANELLRQPEAPAVGGEGWYAVRNRADTEGAIAGARAVGPPPPPLMPALPRPRTTVRQRVVAALNDWRHRKTQLPEHW